MNQRHGIKPCTIIQRESYPTTENLKTYDDVVTMDSVHCAIQSTFEHTSYIENRIPLSWPPRQPCWRQRDIETDSTNHKSQDTQHIREQQQK